MVKTSMHTDYTENSSECIDGIVIGDNITTDELEYDSYEEATITAEMLSLQNIRIEKHDGKYKLVICSEAMDCDGKRLKVGDKVHYGLLLTWEITNIEKTDQYSDILRIRLKSGECTECIRESVDEEGKYIFYQLKAGKITARYIACLTLTKILKSLDTMDDTSKFGLVMLTPFFLIGLLCGIGLLVMNTLKGGIFDWSI